VNRPAVIPFPHDDESEALAHEVPDPVALGLRLETGEVQTIRVVTDAPPPVRTFRPRHPPLDYQPLDEEGAPPVRARAS